MSKWEEEFCEQYRTVGNLKRITQELKKENFKQEVNKTTKTKLGKTL